MNAPMPRFTFELRGVNPMLLLVLLASGSVPVFAAKPPVVDGEKFALHTIVDRQQGGMTFVALMAPEKWQVTGEVRWKYEDVSSPVSAFVRVANPATPETVTFFPRAACYWLQGASAFNRPGTTALGQMNVQPLSPAEALRSAVLKLYRPGLADLQIVGTREMPALAAALKADPKSYKGVGLRVLYAENGQPIEEEFYALHYLVQIPYDGPQGHSVQTNWGLDYVHSFKTTRGALDKRRGVMAYVVHSVRPNPQWRERAEGIQHYLNEQFNRNLAQGYANIDAAGRLSRQISANNDAMISSMERQRAAARATAPVASGRSANDKFSDYLRGVDTMDDPRTGTSQHSNKEQFHWTDGYGNYTHSNDGSFNPNLNSNITWQQMTPAR